MLQTRIVPNKPALILEGEKKHLVISDLHIGFESEFISNNIFIGKNSTINETISEVNGIIDSEKPESIILLGDIKSSITNISKSEWEEIPLFFEEISKKCNVILIPGNHDSNIQKLVSKKISMISATGMVEEDILLTHGHTMPSRNFSEINKIVMGHLHPVFFDNDSILSGQRVWIAIKIEKENIFPNKKGDLEILIIPAFNRYFYAANKRKYKKSISPIIEKIKNVSSAKVVTLDGSIIGDENSLDQII